MRLIVILVSRVRYHGDWRSETQTVVSLLTFTHYLETGNLLLHNEAGEKLGCMPPISYLLVLDMFSVISYFHDCNTIYPVGIPRDG